MFATLKKTRGETLIEVLVAIIVLVVGVLAALRMLSVASLQNTLTAQNVQAVNLAREGLEAVREIRDTNWLRFGGERRACWNALNNDCQSGGDRNRIKPDSYTVAFDPADYRWKLTLQTGVNLNLTADSSLDTTDEKYRLYLKEGLYNHDASGKKTVFFREIKWEYLKDDGTTTGTTTDNMARVTAKVEWYDRGRFQNVTLSTVLTDFLGRTSLID